VFVCVSVCVSVCVCLCACVCACVRVIVVVAAVVGRACNRGSLASSPCIVISCQPKLNPAREQAQASAAKAREKHQQAMRKQQDANNDVSHSPPRPLNSVQEFLTPH